MAIFKATLAKEISNVINYIYPKTVADIVEFDNSELDANHATMSVQDKLEELHNGLSDFESDTATNFTQYYTKLNIDDMLYKPVTIDKFTTSVTVAEIGTSGTTTLSWQVTRHSPITALTVAGDNKKSVETSNLMGETTYSGTVDKSYSSSGTTQVSNTFSMSVTDKATTNHAATTKSKEVSIAFYYPVYYGILDSTTITASQVKNLTKKLGSNSKGAGSYSYAANTTNGYLWFCCQSGETVEFAVNGFKGGFESPVVVSNVAVNSNISTSYNCYRSTNRQNAKVTVVVS